jgi:hemoglobin/transferrin/lactoferrin receptor protein
MNVKYLSFLAKLISLLFASIGFAANAQPLLEETIVTAAQAGLSATELPYSTAVISEQALTQDLPRNMVEAMRAVAGVAIQKTANGQGSPFIRGFTGYRTLAMIDGVRYNNSVYRDGPNEYFSLIDNNVLANIELIKGPASALYGSDSIGGTINLQTKSALGKSQSSTGKTLSGLQKLRYSSAEDSFISRTELYADNRKGWGIIAGLSVKNFGNVDAADIGEQAKTGYQEQAVDFRIDGELNEYWQLTIVHQNTNQDDVWRTHSTTYAKSFKGTIAGDDLRRVKDQTRSLSYLKLRGNNIEGFIDEVELTLSGQTWDEDSERVKDSNEKIEEYFESRMNGLSVQLTSDTTWGSLRYGADFYRDRVDTGRIDYNSDDSIRRIRIQGPVGDDSRFDVAGAFIQAEISPTDRLMLIIGSRSTYTAASIGAYEDPQTGLPNSYTDSWNKVVSSLRSTYTPDEDRQWRIWGGLSQSFRAPNIADISRYGRSRSSEFDSAATNLEPEEFLTGEIGFRKLTASYELSGSYYYTAIDNYIVSLPTGNVVDQLTEVRKQNSSAGYMQGMELAVVYKLDEAWQASANFTWLDGELETFDQATNRLEQDYFSRLMPITTNAALEWQSPLTSWWFRLSLTRAEDADKLSQGDMEDTQRIPVLGTPGYTLLKARFGAQLNEDIAINFGINNILNEAYRSHGSGTNEPGLGIVLGITLNL